MAAELMLEPQHLSPAGEARRGGSLASILVRFARFQRMLMREERTLVQRSSCAVVLRRLRRRRGHAGR